MTQSLGKSQVEQPYSIKNLPPLIIGGAVFNNQYSDDPFALPAKEIIQLAFENGLNALDTSPYYGPSEEIIGAALREVSFSRDQYYICTKAGRVKLDEFDYSPKSVRASIERSCKRLGTTYLDLVYMHDIEFVPNPQILEALRELKKLKDEGVVKNFGISGYPVDLLYEIALASRHDVTIGPLDAILSYSNGCIQNTRLFDVYEKLFSECGVKKLMNGSILSMSLLRLGSTLDFHPGSAELKKRVAGVASELLSEGIELADLSVDFAIKKWLFDTKAQSGELEWNRETSIVLGVNTVGQLKDAIASYWKVKTDVDGNIREEVHFKKVKLLLGEHYDEVWESGIKRE